MLTKTSKIVARVTHTHTHTQVTSRNNLGLVNMSKNIDIKLVM